jgi:hypothetical protein
MCAATEKKETTWYTGTLTHEGFPLMLRFPEKPDFDSLQKRYTKFLTIEQRLEKVQRSGLPEPDYNDTLFPFDEHVLSMLGDFGFPVLVETFGGKRAYYIYVTADVDLQKAEDALKTKFPEHKTTWEIRDAKGWKFIRKYSEEYAFYKKNWPARTED